MSIDLNNNATVATEEKSAYQHSYILLPDEPKDPYDKFSDAFCKKGFASINEEIQKTKEKVFGSCGTNIAY